MGPHTVGPNQKVALYTLQLPSVWTAAGVALDLSADFDFVSVVHFGASGVITDHARKYNIIGTQTTSGKGNGMIAAASVKLVAHHDPADAGAALQAFASVADSVDLSSVNDLLILVEGC
jgi:hypothetical protein